MKVKESEIKNAIWQLCDAGRGFFPSIKSQVDLILVLLMWAKYFPYSDKKIIGFFDVLESIEHPDMFDEIINNLSKKLEFNVELIVLLNPQRNSKEFLNFINFYRSSLMPIAKLLIKGDENDAQKIINILMELISSEKGLYPGINKAFLNFSEKLFDHYCKEIKEINCLFSLGSANAFNFAKKRDVYFHELNLNTKNFIKGLISLYGQPLRFISSSYRPDNEKTSSEECKREITFAAPPLGLKTCGIRDLYPLEEDEDSQLITDSSCKMIYLAHKNTSKITIAFTNLGILFSKSLGINYFREKLIINNWIDSIILLPNGVFSNTAIQGALLVLRKDRKAKEKIQFIDFSNCKKDDNAKRGNLIIQEEEINNLLKTYTNKKENDFTVLIDPEQIKSNNYDLNFAKYFISKEDKNILRTLNNRETLTLDSLVEFIRPLAIRKSFEGPTLGEAMISDIDKIGELRKIERKTAVSDDFLTRAKNTFIKKGDLLISIKGTVGKIGIVRKDLKDTIPGPSLCVLRIRPSAVIEPESIFLYLRSEIGQRIITNSSQGATIPFLSIKELKNLDIPLPNQNEEIKTTKISKKLRELNQSIEKMQLDLDKYTREGWLEINANEMEDK